MEAVGTDVFQGRTKSGAESPDATGCRHSLSRSYPTENRCNSANTADVFRFKQTFTYDRWGNRAIDVGNTTAGIPGLTNQSCVIDANTNRMTSLNSLTIRSDTAGNRTNDGSYLMRSQRRKCEVQFCRKEITTGIFRRTHNLKLFTDPNCPREKVYVSPRLHWFVSAQVQAGVPA